MKLTYNGVTYELTNAQAQGLRYAAMQPSGAFYMDRRNDATEAKLAAMGLLVEDYAVRDAEERRVRLNSVQLDLETAQGLCAMGRMAAAEEKTSSVLQELRTLNRMRHYLTEAGYAVVLRMPGKFTGFVPARFRRLLPESEYCAEHGRVTPYQQIGSDVNRCPHCETATSITAEEAARFAAER